MKIFFLTAFFLFSINFAYSAENLIFFLESAYKNNPRLNAERENFKATKQNVNISKSEYLPSVSINGKVNSTQSFNRTDNLGNILSDTSSNTETKEISIDQKIFQGFVGYNSLKKSQLEVKKGKNQLKKIEQEIILGAATAFYDLIYKTKKKEFNAMNVDLFERQVETDSIRVQKGEITLTDLAQSESSLADSRAKFITSETELLTTKMDFERVTRLAAPNLTKENQILDINLPMTLSEAISNAEKNNPKLIIARLDYAIAEKDVDIKKAEYSPSASINYSKSENKDYSSTINELDQESVKATIKWPIIKGGKNYSSIKKSQFIREQNSLLLKDAENEVKTNSTNAWSVYRSSESVLRATELQVKAAEIANEGISLEYDSGNTRTTLEVIQSRSLLLTSRIANAKAKRDLVVSKFKLLSELGSLTLANIKKI
jgi:outer membrane protein